jgi:hypothetical protein
VAYPCWSRHDRAVERREWTLQAKQQQKPKNKEYLGHFTLAMAKVVPPNDEGVREINGWTFYYTGWTSKEFDEATYVRDDATQLDLKPKSCCGCLDVDILKKHGCDFDRVREDPLFFYQLLFCSAHPTCLTLRMMDKCHTSPTLQRAPMFMHQLLRTVLERMRFGICRLVPIRIHIHQNCNKTCSFTYTPTYTCYLLLCPCW